jgi:hypothetical protein
MRALVVGGTIAALAAAVQPAAAQTTLGWDAALFSSYVWRGLTLTNKPVFQPDLYLTVPVGKASFTAGGWANIDIGKYDNANSDISESGGTSAFNFAEFDPWAELAVTVGKATITGGATAYIYPNNAGLTSDFNTVEVYGKLGLALPLSPKISAYYDVDKVKGLYVEGSVTQGIPLGATKLNLGALASFDAGQDAEIKNGVPTAKFFNFADNGLVHMDFSASVPFTAGPLSIVPAFHLVWCKDDLTQFSKPGTSHDIKVWGGATISWSKAFGGKAEE